MFALYLDPSIKAMQQGDQSFRGKFIRAIEKRKDPNTFLKHAVSSSKME